jgi:AraC-like DNA-binding protein
VSALVQAVEGGERVLGGCARLVRLHASSLVAIDLWQCLEDGDGLRAERSHDAPVVTVLLSGASVLEQGGRASIMEAGTALLTPAGVPYRSAHPFGCGDVGCHVRPSWPLLDDLGRRAPADRLSTALAARVHLRFRAAVEAAAHGRSDALELEEAALSLLGALPRALAAAAPPASSRRHVDLVERTKSLLLRRAGDRLSLAQVAGEVGSSAYHLARVFRRHTGLSLHGYRTRVRLLSALDRVAEARGALTALALELGFASQSHLTDAFRRTFGIPPGALARGRSASRNGRTGWTRPSAGPILSPQEGTR